MRLSGKDTAGNDASSSARDTKKKLVAFWKVFCYISV